MSLGGTALRLWVAAPSLEPGETIEHRSAANTYKGARSIGGQVTVTDRRVIFTPNRLDSITGGHRQEITRSEIIDVEDTSVRNPTIYPTVAIHRPGGTLTMTVRDAKALKDALT